MKAVKAYENRKLLKASQHENHQMNVLSCTNPQAQLRTSDEKKAVATVVDDDVHLHKERE